MEEEVPKRSLWQRLRHLFWWRRPISQEDVLSLITKAHAKEIISEDTFSLINNALAFSKLEVRDAMVTYSQMKVVHINDSLEKIIDFSIKTSHSRFPVIANNEKDEVVGILHVKDVLKFFFCPAAFSLKAILREVVYVPEGKFLPTLIKEFREKRNHLAIVVDEYGGVSGLVTLEDVIEQVFGSIEDEFDPETTADIIKLTQNTYQVNATTKIEEFNKYFSVLFEDEEVDTVGGLALSLFGYMPSKGESIEAQGIRFQVVRVDRRRILSLKITQLGCDKGATSF
ncbi:MAG: transporter associated domain-containing protein [Neisseriaceae bacterium]